jgi:deazaflavin-dependent oxidoreductase (nitroreductase family)
MNDTTNPAANTPSAHYQAPGWFTRNVFNRAVSRATRLGLSVWGSRVLEIPGRGTGLPRRTPVNLLTVDGTSYLVAARGRTQWVRNLEANHGGLTLIHGRRREEWTATEVVGIDRERILRAYLARWKAEVGVFFDGVGPKSPDADLARIAGDHPTFRLTPVTH